MQALILAAGMGRRLGELTRENTKCMVKVHGRSLIERMLDQLASLSVDRIVLVIGYEGQKVRDLVGQSYKGIPVCYVENEVYASTNNIYSLYLAKEFLLEDDTILLESDLILDDQILVDLTNNPYPSLAVVAKYQSWMDGTVLTLDDDCNITGFIPKRDFDVTRIESYYKTVNIYKFSKSFSTSHYVPFLQAYTNALGNNEYYEQVLRVITLLERPEIKAIKTTDKWYEIDDIPDLNNAEVLFAPDDEKYGLVQGRYGGYWRYPDMLDYCYLVNPFFPNERLKAELRANFDVLLSSYPSGQNVNNSLAGNVFRVDKDMILTGNGAAELIKGLMTVLEGTTAVVLPTFEEYPNAGQSSQIRFYTSSAEGFIYGLQDLKDWAAEHDQLLLINPDNPSGNYIKREEVLELASYLLKSGKRLILDESFVDFSDEGPDASLINGEVLNLYPNLLVVKSISKSYGVPGLRLGVLASADATLLNDVRKHLSIWNINSFGEFFMQIIDKYKEDYVEACGQFRNERQRFLSDLQKIPYLQVFPSQANYFLCRVLAPHKAGELATRLLIEDGVLVKDCRNKAGFDGAQFLRLAIRDKRDNNKLIKALMTK